MAEQMDDPVVVGSYVDEDRAGEAAERLRSAGFEDVAAEEITSGVWQVRVPSHDAQGALHELQPREARSIQTHL